METRPKLVREIDGVVRDGGDEEIGEILARVAVMAEGIEVRRRPFLAEQRTRVRHATRLEHDEAIELPKRLRARRVYRRDHGDAVRVAKLANHAH